MLVDWRRFAPPRQLAAYLGLVPSEDSSGDRERKGAITKAGKKAGKKAGNTHWRHALIQAAWSSRYGPTGAAHLKTRPDGQPPGVLAHAWQAQQRRHKRYTHLAYRKQPQVAVVAGARERIGFLWAVPRDVAPGDASAPAMAERVTATSGVACGWGDARERAPMA